MNKTIKYALATALVAIASYGIHTKQNIISISNLVLENLENIEALADPENSGPNSNGNTGPSELYDCPLWFTGDGIHCKCENAYSCTAVSCD